MNDDLTPRYEAMAGQVILESRRPAGPAGEAGLVPVPGLELAFDRADGHLARAIVPVDNASAAALLTRLFGAQAPGLARAAAEPAGEEAAALTPDAGLCAALSSLARLDATRATSPVSGSSPWWAVEAAVLAERAGLHSRAVAEARRGVRALAFGQVAVPGQAAEMALAAAGIVHDSDADAVRRLRDSIVVVSEPRRSPMPGFDVAAEVEALEKDGVRLSGPQWVLDPGLAPGRLLRPGLSPHSDLVVRHENSAGRLVVTATLMQGADPAELGALRARLVDPAIRRVLAIAGFGQSGSRVQAEFHPPFPLDEVSEAWIEVVDRSDRPVLGAKVHRMRRALRWADAALRAERAPAGLASRADRTDWAALAAVAWQRCRRDWVAAGDARGAAVTLAPRTPLQGPACLAEVLGE
jgi:hypothetical protein